MLAIIIVFTIFCIFMCILHGWPLWSLGWPVPQLESVGYWDKPWGEPGVNPGHVHVLLFIFFFLWGFDLKVLALYCVLPLFMVGPPW